MDGENVVYMHNGVLFIYKTRSKLNDAIYRKVNETGNHHVKWKTKKPDSKRQDSFIHRICMGIDTT